MVHIESTECRESGTFSIRTNLKTPYLPYWLKVIKWKPNKKVLVEAVPIAEKFLTTWNDMAITLETAKNKPISGRPKE
jgi:hypothetical protein